ncbi:MAG: hypothetical protein M3384_09615 [Acidobacteriota bacterium]|nr:hypothetical protein [Acidobacteriota bacterium]
MQILAEKMQIPAKKMQILAENLRVLAENLRFPAGNLQILAVKTLFSATFRDKRGIFGETARRLIF